MNPPVIDAEFRGAELGDRRRSERLERIGVQLARDPGLSFPEAMGSEGQLEALYRFLNNDQVSFDAVHAPHLEATRARCAAREQVLVLHDTTAMKFSGEREGLGRTQTVAQGFFLHASLVVTPDRMPIGVLGAETWVRRGPVKGRRNRRDTRRDPTRESLRWWRAVEACEERLDSSTCAVHVMDREGDNFDLFSRLQANSCRFVIRLAHDRNLVGETEKLKHVVARSECLFQREVSVASRLALIPRDDKIHPRRHAREATLAVSATTVELRRSNNFAPGCPPSLRVNVVTVTERNCPADATPITWYLVTSEPVDTVEQVEAVVDAYRARWVIEEFFKALKTGCNFERRQLESFQSLRIALAIFLPIAVQLLALRGAARAEPTAPCVTLSPRQVHLLRTCGTRPLSPTPTNAEVYAALAALGGHLRSNGAPGWIVLGRAYERLLVLEQGWLARSKTGRKCDR